MIIPIKQSLQKSYSDHSVSSRSINLLQNSILMVRHFKFKSYLSRLFLQRNKDVGAYNTNAILFIIILFSPVLCMDPFTLYSLYENQEEKNLYASPDSLSPTPSPQPINRHLEFTQELHSPIDFDMGSPVLQGAKGSRRGRKSSEQSKNMNRGHWSIEENKRYHWFLQIHYRHFVNRHMRRMDKIFKSMELFVGTRQAEQCRSHHQKMEKKYHTFITIIINLRKIHYSTSEIERMLHDMIDNGVNPIEGVATIEELKALEHNCPAPIEPSRQRKKIVLPRVEREDPKPMIKEEYKEELEKVQEQKSEENQYHGNMLEESNNNIGELSLYHEDNSCIFNSIFK